MTKADKFNIPTTKLEQEIARLALKEARALVAKGHTPEDAARLACKGSWAEWAGWVLARLKESNG